MFLSQIEVILIFWLNKGFGERQKKVNTFLIHFISLMYFFSPSLFLYFADMKWCISSVTSR